MTDEERKKLAEYGDFIRSFGTQAKELRQVDPIGDIKGWWQSFKDKSYFRLVLWLALSVACLFASKNVHDAQWAAALWKFGFASAGGWVAYWLFRSLSGIRPHLVEDMDQRIQIERTRVILVIGVMIALSLG